MADGNGGHANKQLTQKIVDSTLLTAIGRLTMAAAGPALAAMVILLFNLQKDQAVTANALVNTNSNVAALNQTIADGHTENQRALVELTQSVKDQLAASKADIDIVMDLRAKLRDATDKGMQDQIDELYFRAFGHVRPSLR